MRALLSNNNNMNISTVICMTHTVNAIVVTAIISLSFIFVAECIREF